MTSYRNIFGKILTLALFWAVSGYIIGAAIEHIMVTLEVEQPYQIGLIVASLNLILGMLLLKATISDAIGDRMFFVGPQSDEDGDVRVACLWVIPIIFFGYGLVAWLIAIILRLVNK